MGNVNIRFVNDGKDKHQSYEAHLDVTSFEAMNLIRTRHVTQITIVR